MELLHKYASTSWPDRWLLLQALLLVVVIRLALFIVAFRNVRHVLNSTSDKTTTVRDAEYVVRVAWAVRSVARRFLGDKPCLVQALAADWFLRRGGFTTSLRLGVVKNKDEEMVAHAWLDCGDITVIGGGKSPRKYMTLKPLVEQREG